MWREYQILSKNSRTIVYLPEEDVYGEIKQQGAHASLVYYYIDGIYFEVMVANEEFIIVDELIVYDENEDK
jgi:hypothetical protein